MATDQGPDRVSEQSSGHTTQSSGDVVQSSGDTTQSSDGVLAGTRTARSPYWLRLIAVLIGLVLLVPVAWLILRALELTPQAAVELLFQPTTVDILLNSLFLVVCVTGLSVILGGSFAVLTAITDLPFSRFFTVILALPLVIPSYIGAFAFVSAFGPRGVLTSILAPIGIERIPSIYGAEGAILVLTLFTYPYVFLTTRAALLSHDGTLLEAARTLNHSRWSAFRRVTLPQIAPGVTAGALLVALYTLSDFGTPAIMHYNVFTRMIYIEYNTFARDLAALLSLVLLLLTVVILAAESRIGNENDARLGSGSGRSITVRLGIWKYPAVVYCLSVAALCLAVPIGILVYWLIRGGPEATYMGFEFSWRYGLNSVLVSALAAGVATLAALPIAYLSARYRSKLGRLAERASYVGYALPGIVLAISLVYFAVAYVPWLYQTIPLLVFAYVVRFIPQEVGTIRTSVLQVDSKLTEAARTLGMGSFGAFRRVTLPLITPGIAAGGALVFLTTMRELPATLVLHPTGFNTLVTYIWTVRGAGYYGLAALPALVLVGISGLSMLVILAQERFGGENEV